ncbi:MAG: LPS export ABC transporter periplasmic protein LptC [Bacteroidetes bacterium]|nr:LPS export ABC transporter periplasmic protein LptC [Bacteroidota bacterium]
MKKIYILIFYSISIFILILVNTIDIYSEPIILKYADKLVGANDESSNSRTLIGNVQLQQGNVNVNCESATQYILLNKYRLTDNVVITQNNLILKSQHIIYDGNSYLATAVSGVTIDDGNTHLKANKGDYSTKTSIANFYDNVVLQDDSVIIYCNYINHNRKTNDSKAINNVLIKGKNTNVFLFGDTVVNISNTNYSLVSGNPFLYRIDTLTQNIQLDTNGNSCENYTFDTLSIKSDTMEAFRSNTNEYYHFFRNVELIKNNISAKANNVYFYKHKQYFVLYDEPVIWYGNSQLHADSIIVYFDDNDIKRIQAVNNAIIVIENDTNNYNRKDQLYGNEINIFFETDSLKIIKSNGNAKSVYFMLNNNEADGLVENNAEKIKITISSTGIDDIELVNQIQGYYHPEQFINGVEKNYYLEEYKFSDNKPIRTEFNILQYIKQ